MAPNPWILSFRSSPSSRLRLLCFPYAGGDVSLFAKWGASLPKEIDVAALQLPGHGSRLAEKALTSVESVVDACARVVAAHCDRPYAFFGHSLGSVLAFELARRFKSDGLPAPRHLFVSARPAPHLQQRVSRLSDLPDETFLEELQGRYKYRIPAAILEDEELLEYVLEILRADMKMSDNYEYEEGPGVDCPLTAFGGETDEWIPKAMIEPWSRHGQEPFACEVFPGGHFYLQDQPAPLLASIGKTLAGYLG